MNKTVTAQQMIDFLQRKMDKFKKMESRLGFEDEYVTELLDELIAQKEMVEALICEPVNLGVDGRVTVGF